MRAKGSKLFFIEGSMLFLRLLLMVTFAFCFFCNAINVFLEFWLCSGGLVDGSYIVTVFSIFGNPMLLALF
jgi:hypothetical protein